MKDLRFLTICPNDTYFTWQIHLWIENLKQLGLSNKATVLIFIPKNRADNPKWQQVIDLYPEAEFRFYRDEHDISSMLGIYISVLRPYTAWRYFKEFPEMSNKAIFYCDSDILFTEKFNIDKFVDDDINYLSDTNSYINASYFDSKVRDVLPEKLEEYKTVDVLNEASGLVGITREICIKNNKDSGGAQYLLKNIDDKYWFKVMTDCISIITYLGSINKRFFENENKGFQKWCADMWAVLWNIWLREQETKVVPELAFAWAPDPINKLETHTIYHNAGVVSTTMGNYPCFYKGKYHQGLDPFKDPHLDVVFNNEESKKHCTWYYVKALKELHEKYQLNY